MEKCQDDFSVGFGSPCRKDDREHKTTGYAYPTGQIQTIGDMVQFTVCVGEFSPEDVIITTSNNLIKVCAEKVGEGGVVLNTFAHKCKFPMDVDPMSVTSSLESSGDLTVRARRV